MIMHNGKTLRIGLHGPARPLIPDVIDAVMVDIDTAGDIRQSCDIVLDLAGAGADRLAELGAAAASGVWAIRYGAASCADAGRAAGQAILAGDPTVSAYLLRWIAEDRRFVVVRTSRLACDARSARATGRRLEASIADLVGPWLRTWPSLNDAHDDARENIPPDDRPNHIYPLALIKLFAISAITRLRRLLYREDWAIGLVHQPISDFLDGFEAADVRWLSAPDAKSFVADPFGYRDGDRLTVLAERYDHGRRKGVIDAMTFDAAADRPDAVHSILDPDIHVSYPFVFEDGGETFCIPETSRSQKVQLYRVDRATARLEHVRDLLSGVSVSDTTLFRHDGRYWLAGICDGPKLYLWYADDLAGNWAPHVRNPVKIDVGSARPAGTPFVHEDVLYRPAQDGSTGYGAAVVLNRITHLNPSEFAEETVMRLTPDRKGPFPDGMHTLSAVGDWTLIDGKKGTLDIFQPLRRLCVLFRLR